MILFKNKNVLALDFCCTKIKVVEGKYLNKSLDINKKFIINIPEDIYKNGIIYDFEHLSYLLDNSLRQYNRLSKSTRVVINSTHIITRNITIPKVSYKEIKAILKYKIEDYMPIRYEDYIIQFIINNNIFENNINKLELLLMAIPKDMVKQHFKLVQTVNLKPEILDFQGNAISKFINYNQIINNKINIVDKTIGIIELDYNLIKINIIKDKSIKLSKVLEIELNDILDNLNSDDIFKRSMMNLLDNINMIFLYYSNQNQEDILDLILLYGEFIQMQNVENYFNEYFNIMSVNLEMLDRFKSNNIHNYYNALGAVVRREEGEI